MIDLEKFNSLWLDDKIKVTKEKGRFLLSLTGVKHKKYLFNLENFYVEVHFNLKVGKVDEIKSFYSTSSLTPYLSKINISDVYNFED